MTEPQQRRAKVDRGGDLVESISAGVKGVGALGLTCRWHMKSRRRSLELGHTTNSPMVKDRPCSKQHRAKLFRSDAAFPGWGGASVAVAAQVAKNSGGFWARHLMFNGQRLRWCGLKVSGLECNQRSEPSVVVTPVPGLVHISPYDR